MQRICNDLSQVTQAKELCTEAVKLQRTMTCMNPDMTSQAKTMGQGSNEHEWKEYALILLWSPSQCS